jgi:hypothetical protein
MGTTFDPWELWAGIGLFLLVLMLGFYYFIRFWAVRFAKPNGRFSADPSADGNDELL